MKRYAIILMLFVLLLAACQGSGPVDTVVPAIPVPATATVKATPQAEEPPDDGATSTPTETTAETPAAIMGVHLADLEGVTVTFWHIWGDDARGEGLDEIVADFNQLNPWGIRVEAVDKSYYTRIEDEILSAVQNQADLPDAAIGFPNMLSRWYQLGVVVDLDPYVTDPVVGLSEEERADFYAGVLAGGVTPEGERVGFPFSQSIYALFYNQSWAQALGFEQAPETAAQLRQQVCAAAAANPDDETGGLVLFPGASDVMTWIFAFDGDVLAEDGSGYDFTTSEVESVAQFWKTLWDEGCAFTTSGYPNSEFATRQALMVMSSSAGIPYQIEAFEEAETDDDWSLLAVPGPGGNRAVNAMGQYIAVVDKGPQQALATWLFVKHLAGLEAQVQWVNASGYYPVRQGAEDLLKTYAAEHTAWTTGLRLLDVGHSEPSQPSWGAVRRAVEDAFAAILTGDLEDIRLILEQLNDTAADIEAEVEAQ
jgi:ABC-type glycerol-3-phosphate transport system substrate-binding protein